jgi:hypothetical protein
VSRGPETAPGAHTLRLFDAAARACVAWSGRGGVGGGGDGEEEEVVAHVGGTVHPEDWKCSRIGTDGAAAPQEAMTSSGDLRIDDFSLFSGFFIYCVARERHEFRKQL